MLGNPSRQWLRLNLVGAALFVVSASLGPARGETLDRIAVTVGTHVIAESEILEDLQVAAFLDGRPADLSAPAKRAAAERMVDQYLILEDAAATRSSLPNASAVDFLLQPIKTRYASNSDFQAALKQAGISEAELSAHLLSGMRLLRYSESRFGGQIVMSEEELRAAYDNLVKSARPSDKIGTFEDSRDRLEELVNSQRINTAMDQWLEATRPTANIVYRDAAFK